MGYCIAAASQAEHLEQQCEPLAGRDSAPNNASPAHLQAAEKPLEDAAAEGLSLPDPPAGGGTSANRLSQGETQGGEQADVPAPLPAAIDSFVAERKSQGSEIASQGMHAVEPAAKASAPPDSKPDSKGGLLPSAANLVTSFRSLLPSKSSTATQPAAGKRAAQVLILGSSQAVASKYFISCFYAGKQISVRNMLGGIAGMKPSVLHSPQRRNEHHWIQTSAGLTLLTLCLFLLLQCLQAA